MKLSKSNSADAHGSRHRRRENDGEMFVPQLRAWQQYNTINTILNSGGAIRARVPGGLPNFITKSGSEDDQAVSSPTNVTGPRYVHYGPHYWDVSRALTCSWRHAVLSRFDCRVIYMRGFPLSHTFKSKRRCGERALGARWH